MDEELPDAHVVSDDTWLILLEHGNVDGEHRSIDYFFYASAKPDAVSLAAHLERQGMAPQVGARRTGRLHLRREWAITGSTLPFALTQATLQAWVVTMYRLGLLHRAPFDGWGMPA